MTQQLTNPPKQLIKIGRGYSVLSPEEQLILCRMVAEFKGVTEIKRWLFKERGKSIAHNTVYEYINAEKWKPVIKKFRTEYLAKIGEIPLANKIQRLERMTRQLDQVESIKRKYEGGKSKLACIDRETEILKRFQEEMEHDNKRDAHQNFYFTQFNNMSREEFDNFRLGLVEKIRRYQEKEIVHASQE